jgi:hypothetical protein
MKHDKFKQMFLEAWDEHIEPHFKNGNIVWRSHKTLDDYLMKVVSGELSDDEIIKLMDDGKL